MRKLLVFFWGLIALVSCGILPQKDSFHQTTTPIELGDVGIKKKTIRKTIFQNFGVPKYSKKIRVSVITKPFTKVIYKKYNQVNSLQKTIVFNDSIQPKPTFIEISIKDKIALVTALNDDNQVLNYLKKSSDAKLVASIRLVADSSIQNRLEQAEAFYLQTDKHKKQWLRLYRDDKEIDKIDLLQNTIFEYQLSSFCWKITSRRKIVIATLINDGNTCDYPTKGNTQELEEELDKDSFKF